MEKEKILAKGYVIYAKDRKGKYKKVTTVGRKHQRRSKSTKTHPTNLK